MKQKIDCSAPPLKIFAQYIARHRGLFALDMGCSVAIALVSGVAGLIVSFYLDTSAGAAIVLAAALFYAASLIIRSRRK